MSLDSRTFIFTDLDDTLIQTSKKIPAGVEVKVGALCKEGRPLSYAGAHQLQLLKLFDAGGAIIIPVTGRNTAATGRVLLPFFNSYRIVSHGALVLKEDNTPCPDWLDHLHANHDLEEALRVLHEIDEYAHEVISKQQLNARCRIIIDFGVPAYLSIKCEEDVTPLVALKSALDPMIPQGAKWHQNGRNMALMMPYTSKLGAVQFVMRSLGVKTNDLLIGLGDSISDIPFMRETQFVMLPRGSQIDEQLGQ
ncbi:MAG: hydroxymethylpyrimidine pyrophosphatase-like HAD family hydrolase [Motiliproteus sp.]|jgi:hydroxymethylpyrimidine pyrophosphatase-like HAD family hydrolase